MTKEPRDRIQEIARKYVSVAETISFPDFYFQGEFKPDHLLATVKAKDVPFGPLVPFLFEILRACDIEGYTDSATLRSNLLGALIPDGGPTQDFGISVHRSIPGKGIEFQPLDKQFILIRFYW